jgi:hypothetical protein
MARQKHGKCWLCTGHVEFGAIAAQKMALPQEILLIDRLKKRVGGKAQRDRVMGQAYKIAIAQNNSSVSTKCRKVATLLALVAISGWGQLGVSNWAYFFLGTGTNKG